LGSLYELKDQLICSLDEGFIENEEYREGIKLIERAIALLNSYNNYFMRKGK